MQRSLTQTFTWVAATALALSLAACTERQKDSLPAPRPATITKFTVTPNAVQRPGDTVRIEWAVVDATSVSLEQLNVGPISIDPTAKNGSLDVTVDEDAIFVLSALGEGGIDARSASVKVPPEAESVLFSVLPPTAEAGQQVTLVWNAPLARQITIQEMGGGIIDVGPMRSAGQFAITATRSARFQLKADSRTVTTNLKVTPGIKRFALEGSSPAPGAAFSIGWETGGGSSLVVYREDLAMPLFSSADARTILSGTLEDRVPAGLPVDGILRYRLEVSSPEGLSSRVLTVRVGGSLRIESFDPPAFVRFGSTATIGWTVVGADSAELLVDGVSFWVASSQTQVNSGGVTIDAPPQTRTLELVVKNNRGGEARARRTIAGVGPVLFNFFTADRTTVPNGGDPVVLSWSISNARRVRVSDTNGAFSKSVEGLVDTGSMEVFPNRAEVTYRLEADNGAGDRINPVQVTVRMGGNRAVMTFDRLLPPAGRVNVTGTNLGNRITTFTGLPKFERNPEGERFIDISQTGQVYTRQTYSITWEVAPLPATFRTVLYGRSIITNSVGIATNGIVKLTPLETSYYNWYDNYSQPANSVAIGSQLEPLTMAVLWDQYAYSFDLRKIRYQLDAVPEGQRLIVQWTEMPAGYSQPQGILTYQVQIYSNGKVIYAYKDLKNLTSRLTAAIGIRNFERNGTPAADELGPTALPQEGDVYRFFGETQVPVPFRVVNDEYVAMGYLNGQGIEVPGDARIPPDRFGIGEVNPNPPTALTGAQWFEVENFQSEPQDLSGWDITFGPTATATNVWTIPEGTIVPANGRMLFAQSSNLGDTGFTAPSGVPVVVYPSTFTMSRSTGSISLGFGGGQYSTVSWRSNPIGRSVHGLEAAILTAPGAPRSCLTSAGNWGTRNQRGTPGDANPSCFPYSVSKIQGNFTSIRSTGTRVITCNPSASGNDPNCQPYYAMYYNGALEANAFTPGSTYKLFGEDITTFWVGSSGWLYPQYASTYCYYGYCYVWDNDNSPTPTDYYYDTHGLLAPFWDGYGVGSTGNKDSVFWREEDPDGTPDTGDETLVVSWERWGVVAEYWVSFPFTGYNDNLNYQIRLKADGSSIEYHYGTMALQAGAGRNEGDRAARARGSSASVWLESPNSLALPYSVNSTKPGIEENTGIRFTRR